MRARRTILASRATTATLIAAALAVAALVAVIGSAQAAPSKKIYSATVRLTDATTSLSTFTLTLTNDPAAQQTLGSANFTPPSGITANSVVNGADRTGWTATIQDGVVAFRSSSSAVGLPRGASVSADVNVTIASSCSATWTTRAKQSNDFSGQPGNDAQLNAQASDLTPLGSFSVSTIETIEDGQHIPAVITGESKTWTATAKDTCGAMKTNYSGATLTRTFLTDATFTPATGLSWSNGVGTVTFTPHVTETGNDLTVTDNIGLTHVTATSNSFDVSDTLCTPADAQPCHWQDKQGNPGILADAASPPSGANLGIGFNSSEDSPPRANFSCHNTGTPVGGSVVNINPRGYGATPYTVSLTYKKSVSGSGPASGFVVCLSEDIDGSTWTERPACPSTPVPANAPCVQTMKRTSGGDLLVVLYLTQGDPWGGVG
jgi:hypothetical protein